MKAEQKNKILTALKKTPAIARSMISFFNSNNVEENAQKTIIASTKSVIAKLKGRSLSHDHSESLNSIFDRSINGNQLLTNLNIIGGEGVKSKVNLDMFYDYFTNGGSIQDGIALEKNIEDIYIEATISKDNEDLLVSVIDNMEEEQRAIYTSLCLPHLITSKTKFINERVLNSLIKHQDSCFMLSYQLKNDILNKKDINKPLVTKMYEIVCDNYGYQVTRNCIALHSHNFFDKKLEMNITSNYQKNQKAKYPKIKPKI